jgi:beta-1,4-mannosyl-glycoprotein beta-1,4-N-acetylglucosaminyltransferase
LAGGNMIYDAIPFFNEISLLSLRMEIMNDYVDYFIVGESPWTFSGKEKPLFFQQCRDQFKKFEDKIIYQLSDDNDPNWNQWERSFYQKGNLLSDTIPSLQEDDIIISSDADEIPDLSKIDFQKVLDTNHLFLCGQTLFYYYLNTMMLMKGVPEIWEGTRILPWKLLRRTSLTEIRGLDNSFLRWSASQVEHVPNAGYHFSYLGGEEAIKYKISSYEHVELDTPYIRSHIQENLDNLQDPFFREGYTLKQIDITPETHPQYLLDHLPEYDKFIYKGKQ